MYPNLPDLRGEWKSAAEKSPLSTRTMHLMVFINKLTSDSIFHAVLGLIIIFLIDVLVFSLIYYLIYKANEKNSFFASDLYKARSKITADSELKLFPDLDPRFNIPQWHLLSEMHANSGMSPEFYKTFIGETIQARETGNYEKMWNQEAWHSLHTIFIPSPFKNISHNGEKLKGIDGWKSLLGKYWEAFKKNYGEKQDFQIVDKLYRQLLHFWKSGESAVPFQKLWVEISLVSHSGANLLGEYLEVPPTEREILRERIQKAFFADTSRQMRLDTRNLFPKLNFWDFLYYSIVNVTTNRYGDIIPVSSFVRIIQKVQAFISYFIL